MSVGEAAAQPGTGRLVWKSICPGRLGSDRALIQVLYELCVLPLLQDAAELLGEGAGPRWHSIVALPQEHVAVAIHPAQPAGQRHQPIGQLSWWWWGGGGGGAGVPSPGMIWRQPPSKPPARSPSSPSSSSPGHWPETVCSCTAEPPARLARPSEYFRRCPRPPPRRQAT